MKYKAWKRGVIERIKLQEGSIFTVGMAVGSSLCMLVSLATATFFQYPLPFYMFFWAGINLFLGMVGALSMKNRWIDPESTWSVTVFFFMAISNLTLICFLPAARGG